jgi:two-component system nitrogen regulation response regulator GlnG
MVEKGQFREDLLYRLNGYTIALPSLIERSGDLELLVDHFRRQANKDLDKEVQGVAPEAMGMLRQYGWPGNVRELQNVIRQAVLKTNGPVLLPDFLPEYVRRNAGELAERSDQGDGKHPLEQLIDGRLRSGSNHVYDEVVSVVEEQLIHGALDYSGGDKLAAIKRLGVNPASFRSTAALELLDLQRVEAAPAPAPTETAASQTLADDLIKPGMTMEEIEKEAIKRALTHTNGRRTEAAQMLGLSVRTLQRRIKEFELDF